MLNISGCKTLRVNGGQSKWLFVQMSRSIAVAACLFALVVLYLVVSAATHTAMESIKPANANPMTTAEAAYVFPDACGLSVVECPSEVVQPKVAVYQSATTQGRASWYAKGLKYPQALTAASRDFRKGTRLRVINQQNGKQIDVTVNDYVVNPEVIIDLSLGAFSQIASPSTGVISVKIEEL